MSTKGRDLHAAHVAAIDAEDAFYGEQRRLYPDHPLGELAVAGLARGAEGSALRRFTKQRCRHAARSRRFAMGREFLVVLNRPRRLGAAHL